MTNLSPYATCLNALDADGDEDAPEMPLYASFAAEEDEGLQLLLDSIDRAAGWVLERTRLSRSVVQVRFEVQGKYLMEVYAGLVGVGLALSRESHLLLNDRCTFVKHKPETRRAIQPLRLEISFQAASHLPGEWGRVASA